MLRQMLRRIALSVSIMVTYLLAIRKARTPDLKVMGASPVEGTFKELIPAFARDTGYKVEGVFSTVGSIRERLEAGERPDVLILSAPVIETNGESRVASPSPARRDRPHLCGRHQLRESPP